MITKLILTDVYIAFTLSGISIAEVANATIDIVAPSGTSSSQYTLAAGDIVISGDKLILKIEDTDITTPGLYTIRMIITDTVGDKLGQSLDEKFINFE